MKNSNNIITICCFTLSLIMMAICGNICASTLNEVKSINTLLVECRNEVESEQQPIEENNLNTDDSDCDNKHSNVEIVDIEKPEFVACLCPYCHSGLSVFSSSLYTSMAQYRCYNCGYYSPEIHLNKPDGEYECIEILKDRMINGGWTEHDFTGD